MSDIAKFLTAQYDEDEAVGDPNAVWQLDHDGYGRTLHATADHAKAEAEQRADGGTYWRWDDGKYWFKRDGETLATIERAPVLGHNPSRVHADLAAKRRLLKLHFPMILRAGGGADYYNTARVCGSCVPPRQFPETAWPCLTARTLALPYADRPGYDDAWRIDV